MTLEKFKSEPDNDIELASSIQKGDKEAWKFVVQKYYKPLFIFINKMVRDSQSSEELLQDVFVNFWEKREQINIITSFKAYLYRSARNHTLNFIKRRKFEQNYHNNLLKTLDKSYNDTEHTFQFSQLEKTLYTAIDELPEKCKEIFKLSRFEDLTYKEISKILDVPVRTVHYQIGIALKELRTILKSDYDPDVILSISFGIVGFEFITHLLSDQFILFFFV